MSTNKTVAEATTQKKPYKFGYLTELITDTVKYYKIRDCIMRINPDTMQDVNDADGRYIQSLLWLCDIVTLLEQLEEAGGHEAKEIQAVVNHLNVLMVENDLDFIFI